MGKSWYYSKTLWANVLAVVAIVAQGQYGYVLTPETQVSILGVLNVILRVVTKEPVEWS